MTESRAITAMRAFVLFVRHESTSNPLNVFALKKEKLKEYIQY